MGKNEDWGSILKKEKLKFKTEKELEDYYEKKWKKEGYKKGYTIFGINLSKMYHKERHDTAFNLLAPKKEERILDAGCGDFRIAKSCKEVSAIDISGNAFSKSKKKAPQNLIFKKMNVENLGFPSNYFDKVYSIETLEHLIKPEKAILEFKRVLKSKGKLVLSYPLIDNTLTSKIQKFLHIHSETPISEHLTNWQYNELTNRVENLGFRLIQSKGVVFDIGKIEKLKSLAKWLVMPIVNFTLSIKSCPRNSLFVIMLFEKIK